VNRFAIGERAKGKGERPTASPHKSIGTVAFLLPSGEKVRMRGSFCATLTLALSLKGEGT